MLSDNGVRVRNRYKSFVDQELVKRQYKSLFNKAYLNILKAEDIRWGKVRLRIKRDNEVDTRRDNKAGIKKDNKVGTGE